MEMRDKRRRGEGVTARKKEEEVKERWGDRAKERRCER